MKHLHVIIPVYNAEKFLLDAVDSVLCKEGNISIVLVNDGSTDSSGAICDKLHAEHPQISVLHQNNGGVSRARNTGIEFVLGQKLTSEDYFAFLDADDLWTPEVSFDALEAIDADIYAFSSLLTDENQTLRKYMYKHRDEVRQFPGANAEWLCHGTFGSCLYRAEMLRQYNLRFMEGVKISEDVIFWNQANFCVRSIVFSSVPLYIYRMNPGSVSHKVKKKTDNVLGVPKAWSNAKEWIKPIVHFTEEEKQRWINKCSAILGPAMLEATQGLAESGFSHKEIQRIVFEDPLAVYLNELDVSKLQESEQPKLMLLRKNAKLFVLKFRFRGFIVRLARRSLNFYPIRKLREWIRFRS